VLGEIPWTYDENGLAMDHYVRCRLPAPSDPEVLTKPSQVASAELRERELVIRGLAGSPAVLNRLR
jgi:hypothetical protein